MSETNPYMMVGERLCMDFINTVSWRESAEKRREWFTGYTELVDWCIHARVLNGQQAKALLLKAEEKPAEAGGVLKLAVEMREVMYRIFKSIAEDTSPLEKDLDRFNEFVSRFYRKLQVIHEKDQFTMKFDYAGDNLDMMLPPIFQSAVDLLVSKDDLERVKQCEGDPCGWLFFDTSRNRSRRWCSMADCGNRAKARRFYKKEK
ncbi:CGNR zinc finger domain-containing protein [[Bacillus] enclensis]|uniref:CGNR zinc finger domain-containing protein n=1 Tax=[Bacillus] enclensis TaxID=1402860 RepID=UPI0018DC1217|nr:CGNR zinc finger domain-containing protein [[Bacillus] enclensis]MBH9964783.1 CGNR zinc finger domain-containing protein [[Bacillus] enclensis]QWC21231.1 CGNR zinc finger domain-containing protein [Bacillus haikouensis]